ncbi:MAG: DoxX family protein [Verrucomicrobia bacterium]|jgi:hypothetical protein|nr:DoxX family protein [Verrucomicrobiota bacterium]
MEAFRIALQVVIGLGILNVWLLRFGKSSPWRGGEATNMKEEFAAYGLSPTVMYLVGFLKVLCAGLLLAGIWLEVLVLPGALGMTFLMLGAVAMHLKVEDPPKKSLPAGTLLVLSVAVLLLQF